MLVSQEGVQELDKPSCCENIDYCAVPVAISCLFLAQKESGRQPDSPQQRVVPIQRVVNVQLLPIETGKPNRMSEQVAIATEVEVAEGAFAIAAQGSREFNQISPKAHQKIEQPLHVLPCQHETIVLIIPVKDVLRSSYQVATQGASNQVGADIYHVEPVRRFKQEHAVT